MNDFLGVADVTDEVNSAIERFMRIPSKAQKDYEDLQKLLENIKSKLVRQRQIFHDHLIKTLEKPEFSFETTAGNDTRPKERKRKLFPQNSSYSNQMLMKSDPWHEDEKSKIVTRKKIKLKKQLPIWENSEIFFTGEFPIKDQIERIFNDNKIIPQSSLFPSVPGEHWTVRFGKFAEKNGLQVPVCNSGSNDEISNFCNMNNLDIQVEEQQKRPKTTINFLLTALVESVPIERLKKNSEPVVYAKKHMLAPMIPYDSYLSLDFNERLALELKSVDLTPSNGGDMTFFDDSPFSMEIEKYKERIREIVPQLEEYKNRVLPNINKYIEKNMKLTAARNEIFSKYIDNS